MVSARFLVRLGLLRLSGALRECSWHGHVEAALCGGGCWRKDAGEHDPSLQTMSALVLQHALEFSHLYNGHVQSYPS